MKKSNDTNFYNYYKSNLNLDDVEFEKFKETLNTNLPITLRISDEKIRSLIEKDDEFTHIPYLKDLNVYQTTKDNFKKSPLRSLIINFTDIGLIYRQEIASMLPVLFLDVKPHHYVLDMCAAPGSKTTQIIEILDDGLLVANDSDSKRCDVLKTHTNKYTFENMIITNNDARNLPSLKNESGIILFDRILCDVPCSGDGTARKNKDIIMKWSEKGGKGLFKTQYEILRRGFNLLKDDGILVYSTCSFNPVENECVVQKALLELDFELIEPMKIEGLKTRPGLKTWTIDCEKDSKNSYLFPNDKVKCLDRCMRIYPHDQDTGGFFIAVLKKKTKKLNITIQSGEQEKGISIGLDKIKEDGCLKLGINVKDISKDEAVAMSIGAIEKNKNEVGLVASLKTNTFEKNYKLNLENEKSISEPDLTKNTLLRCNKKDSDFYLVSNSTKKEIEQQFNTKINFDLVTLSETSKTIRLVSKKIIEILKYSCDSARIFSAGCKAFSSNNFKNMENSSFRCGPGILEKIGYEDDVICLSKDDTLKLLSNEITDVQDMDVKNIKRGMLVVKLYAIEGFYSAWSSINKMSIFLDKKYKAAFIDFLKIASE